MFVVNICQDYMLKFITSQIIRAGLRVLIASLHRLGCQKMLVKLTKIMPKIRASLHSSWGDKQRLNVYEQSISGIHDGY
jgi:hypothetical protein